MNEMTDEHGRGHDDERDDHEHGHRALASGARVWLLAGALVATVATVWSLYLSFGLGLVPCELCWYQRICMYPLTVVLGVAAFEDRPAASRTVLPLSLVGTGIAAYHSWLQLTPSATCTVGGCSSIQYTFLGLSTPNLALCAFVLVSLSVLGARR